MRPDCTITEDDINALVDDELRGREQRRVAAHVAVCPDCRGIAGATLASKRMLGAKGQPLDVPLGSWDRVARALDEADSVATAMHAASRGRAFPLVPALAACGIVLIVAAAAWHSRAGNARGDGVQFVRSHEAACALLLRAPHLAVHDVAVANPGRASWAPVARWLTPLNGEFVDHTFFRVGSTPISQFVVSTRAFNPDGLETIRTAGGTRYLVRAEQTGSVVAWETGGLMHVLVGRIGPNQLLALADARRAQGPTVRSM